MAIVAPKMVADLLPGFARHAMGGIASRRDIPVKTNPFAVIRKRRLATAALGLIATHPLMAQTTPSGMGHPHMMVIGDGMGGMHGGSGGLMMLLRFPDVTPAQQSQVQQIIASAQSQMKPLHVQMEAFHHQIADKLLGLGRSARRTCARWCRRCLPWRYS